MSAAITAIIAQRTYVTLYIFIKKKKPKHQNKQQQQKLCELIDIFASSDQSPSYPLFCSVFLTVSDLRLQIFMSLSVEKCLTQ